MNNLNKCTHLEEFQEEFTYFVAANAIGKHHLILR